MSSSAFRSRRLRAAGLLGAALIVALAGAEPASAAGSGYVPDTGRVGTVPFPTVVTARTFGPAGGDLAANTTGGYHVHAHVPKHALRARTQVVLSSMPNRRAQRLLRLQRFRVVKALRVTLLRVRRHDMTPVGANTAGQGSTSTAQHVRLRKPIPVWVRGKLLKRPRARVLVTDDSRSGRLRNPPRRGRIFVSVPSSGKTILILMPKRAHRPRQGADGVTTTHLDTTSTTTLASDGEIPLQGSALHAGTGLSDTGVAIRAALFTAGGLLLFGIAFVLGARRRRRS